MKHLIGAPVTVEGRYVRQLCQWCGKRLMDTDLALVAQPEGEQYKVRGWTVGGWLDVVEVPGSTMSTLVTDLEDGKMPMGSCMEDVSPRLRVVKEDENDDR